MKENIIDSLVALLLAVMFVGLWLLFGGHSTGLRAPAPLTPERPALVLPNTPEGFLVFEGVLHVPPETRAVETDGTEHREDGGKIAIEREARIDFIYNPKTLWVLDF